MTERKFAILFAATLLSARKLMGLGDRPSPAKFAVVEDAISNAKFILDRIDKKWPERETIHPGPPATHR
jgi:hypothetical protein